MQTIRTFALMTPNPVRRCWRRLLWLTALTLLLAWSAADAKAQAPSREEAAVPPAPLREAAANAGAIPGSPIVVRGEAAADPIVHAVEEYRRSGSARTIRQSTFVAYPYGHAQPTLTCAPLRACVVELEGGEIVMGLVAGDTERWIIDHTFAGPGGATPLIVVKPTDFDLTTNLVISTDRRIYELTLDAPPASEQHQRRSNPQQVYNRRIRFYYPDDMVRTFEVQRAAQARAEAALLPMNEGFRLENLNFNYEWRPSRRFPFDVEQVFDDGAHTYIKLPASAENEVAPVLFILDGGERAILNYAVRQAGEGSLYYITDRVFRHGVLVLGRRRKNWLGRPGHAEETLRILNLEGN